MLLDVDHLDAVHVNHVQSSTHLGLAQKLVYLFRTQITVNQMLDFWDHFILEVLGNLL